MKRLVLTAAAVVTAACATAAPEPRPGFDAAPYLAQAHAVAPHVWLVRQPFATAWHGNVTVVEQADGLVVIDAGGSPGDGRHIVSVIRALSPKPVKAVALTHWHDDHSLGLSAFVDVWPDVRVIAATAALEGMRTKMIRRASFDGPDPALEAARAERFAPSIAAYEAQAADAAAPERDRARAAALAALTRRRLVDYAGSYIVPPTELVEDALTLPDAEAPVELVFLGRANTSGDLVANLPRQGIVAVGDIVVQPVPYGFSAHPGDWVAVLRALDAMDFDALIPGHGELTQDRLYLRLMLWSLKDLNAQVAALAAEGLTLEEVKPRLDRAAHREKWAPHDPDVWIDAIAASAFNEARGADNDGGL